MNLWPFRRLGFKALSVGLAILLWMAVAGEQTVERVLHVPLELQQFPAELELVGDFPTGIDVRVRGSAGTLNRLSSGDVVAVLNLQGAEPGPKLFQVTTADIRAPLGVEVVQVNPGTVAMTFVNPAVSHAAAVAGDEGQHVERTLQNRPLELRNLDADLTASAAPGQVDVSLSGTRDELVLVQPSDVIPYVDLSGLTVGQYALTVRVEVDREAAVSRVAPSTVQVRITHVRH